MRKIVKAVGAIALAFALVFVSSAAHATTAAEKAGCGGYSTLAYANYAVQYGGVSYPQYGNLYIYKKKVDGNWRFCAVGLVDTKTVASIKIGTRKQGDTSNPVTYYYSDSGTVSSYIGGVALTPSDGRCAAVKLTVTKNSRSYTRFLTYNMCN
ncbi:MAG: hypothetical protein ABJA64_00455 [Candidatus Saccharibacteria bacterium]